MADNTFIKDYVDGIDLTELQLDTAFKTVQPDITQLAQATVGSVAGQYLQSQGENVAPAFAALPDPVGAATIRNYGLNTSLSSGALSVQLKTSSASDPTSTDKVTATFTNNGTTSASYTTVNVTTATAVTIPNSATLGFTGTSTNRVFIYLGNNGGTATLVVSALSNLDNGKVVATTGLGAGADSAAVAYSSGSASLIVRLLGYVEAALDSTKAWQTPTKVSVLNNLPPAPGYVEGARLSTTSSVPVGGIAVSNSCGNFNISGLTETAVTNFSITTVCSGRPMKIAVIPDGTTNAATLVNDTPVANLSIIRIKRDGSTVATQTFTVANTLPNAIGTIDLPGLGTNTYTVTIQNNNPGASTSLTYCRFVAYEL